MALDRSQHQGLYGESFVRVLASAAGLTVARPDLDVDGTDFTLGYPGALGTQRHPKIEVQVKSWARRRARLRDGYWRYHLRARHFNELAGDHFALPRYLIVVIVPDDYREYISVDHDAARLRHAAYWQSLERHDPVTLAPNSRVSVPIPEKNLLTVDALVGLMASGEPTRMGV
ncbi:DUF4365 domain-containing protein [Fodinicola acaciae]|uniref:DUF4365 domain-containing protein n=1 Tax=Fodinicola acaciae TaxID=2681555 RepID=UPI0013D87DF3|nr:DUF4365 domain-containing protein [Fodinicola acaciae]